MVRKLYIFKGSAFVRAVMITAEALGVELEIHEMDFFKEEHLRPEYLKLNPQHTVPVLDDNGIVIWDSHAINAYLVRKYGKDDSFYPKDFHKRAIVDQRLHFDSAVTGSLLRTIDWAFVRKEITEIPAHLVTAANEAYQFLEKFLEGHPWMAGESITIADFNLIPTVTCLDYHVKIDSKLYPNISSWIKRAQELPCFVSDIDILKYSVDAFDKFKGIK